MPSRDPSVELFARSHCLVDGRRVRLRLARPGDQRLLAALLRRLGFSPSEPDLLRLVRFDPRRRAMICATALVGGREQIVGFGAIELDAPAAPATVVADPDYGFGLGKLLRLALQARAHARNARLAA
jgi:hypothetical protein